MTLDELVAKVPEKFRPIAIQYGPALVAMAEADIVAWIDMVARGKTEAAYEALLAKLPNQGLLQEWQNLNQEWADANAEESRRRQVVREAGAAILKVLLAMALASVGL